MNKTTKALLIPIAAFAVTVTGASAFNSEVLQRAGLSTEQITAFEEAHELRKEGDKEAARDVLVEAGIDVEAMHAMHDSMREYHAEMHEAMEEALKDGDYEAFTAAIADSPLAEEIGTLEEFERFQEAHELRESGDKEGARAIMEELGLEGSMHNRGHHGEGDDDFEGKGHGRFNGFRGETDSE